MTDLIILEFIVGALLFISVARPFFRLFRGIDGINVLPGMALLLCVASVPAFGFRPELLPLFLAALGATFFSLPRLADIARGLRVDDYGERSLAAAALKALALVFCVGFAMTFQPDPAAGADESAAFTEGVTAVDGSRGAAVRLRILRPETGDQAARFPIAVVAPPILGSAGMVDAFVEALVSRGYFTVVLSRPGLDVPAVDAAGGLAMPRVDAAFGALSSLFWGHRWKFAADRGAALEAERLADLSFAASYAVAAAERRERAFVYADPTSVALVGFGAGGSAALYAAAGPDALRYRAAVAVEPALLSLRVPRAAGAEGPSGVSRFLSRFGLERVALPGAAGEIPSASIPALLLLSDRIQDVRSRDGRYAGAIRYLRAAAGPGFIASFGGAGPADFSDVPSEYPVYGFFSPPYEREEREAGYYAERAAEAVAAFLSVNPALVENLDGIRIEKKD